MYNNSFYNPQVSLDRINNQITELERLKSQLSQPTQPTAINQTFQLAGNSGMKYVNTIDDVQKELVATETPFFSKDMSVIWIKNTKGEIKSYELNEIVQKDEKDMRIEFLQAQIDEMRKEMNKNEPSYADANEPIKDEKSTSISKIPRNDKKSK